MNIPITISINLDDLAENIVSSISDIERKPLVSKPNFTHDNVMQFILSLDSHMQSDEFTVELRDKLNKIIDEIDGGYSR